MTQAHSAGSYYHQICTSYGKWMCSSLIQRKSAETYLLQRRLTSCNGGLPVAKETCVMQQRLTSCKGDLPVAREAYQLQRKLTICNGGLLVATEAYLMQRRLTCCNVIRILAMMCRGEVRGRLFCASGDQSKGEISE